MLEPVDDHFRKYDRKDRLADVTLYQLYYLAGFSIWIRTDMMVCNTPFPLSRPLGSKPISDPMISIRFRPAIKDSMRDRENRSTMSIR